jgi:hypothetical protein
MAIKKTKYSPLFSRVSGAMKVRGIFNTSELAGRVSVRLGHAIGNKALIEHLNGDTESVRADVILALADELDYSARWLHSGEGDPQKEIALSDTYKELHGVFGELSAAAKDELVGYAYKLLRISGRPTVAAPYPPVPRAAKPK